MSTQAIVALGTGPLLVHQPDPHAHHRYDAARLARSWRKARRHELTDRWMKVLGAKAKRWEVQSAGAR